MVSRIPGVAGPASFQRRFVQGLKQRSYRVEFGWPVGAAADAVMVIGGSRQLGRLRQVKRDGVPLVQRLNGMNWIHRKRRTGVLHFLRAELNNWLLRAVRSQADIVIYQSKFAREWWEREHGEAPGQAYVVHNGVPLDRYSPAGPERPPADHVQMAVIEGRFGGGYEVGLTWAQQLAQGLEATLDKPVRVAAAGAAAEPVRRRYSHQFQWLGVVPPESIPGLHRASHFLFAADLHPACPNSVLEAMACGNPVAAFATGAIPELIDSASGAVAEYGADSWQVEAPDVQALVRAALPVVQQQKSYRKAARARAERDFGLDGMVEAYLTAMGWSASG